VVRIIGLWATAQPPLRLAMLRTRPRASGTCTLWIIQVELFLAIPKSFPTFAIQGTHIASQGVIVTTMTYSLFSGIQVKKNQNLKKLLYFGKIAA